MESDLAFIKKIIPFRKLVIDYGDIMVEAAYQTREDLESHDRVRREAS